MRKNYWSSPRRNCIKIPLWRTRCNKTKRNEKDFIGSRYRDVHGWSFRSTFYGSKLGLNVSSLTGDGSNFRAGMNVGIFANYRINKLLAIQPEFYYSMQGLVLMIYRFSRKLWNRTILHTIWIYQFCWKFIRGQVWMFILVLNSASVSMMNIKRSWREKRFRPKIWNHMDMAIRLKHSIFSCFGSWVWVWFWYDDRCPL